MNNQQNIIHKIHQFVSRYYRNEMLKGGFLLLLVSLSAFIVFVAIEYFWLLNTTGRAFLFFAWLAIVLSILTFKIVDPFLKMFRLKQGLNAKQAAEIIGKHFPEVNDKLLNTVQLIEHANEQDNELLIASINQRSESLSPIPFTKAINLKKTYDVVKWAIVPVVIFTFLWFYSPKLITESTSRIVNYQEEYLPKAPFNVQVKFNGKLFTYEDMHIVIDVDGQTLPDEVHIAYNDVNYLCNATANSFEFTINQVQESGFFFVEAAGFTFGPYQFFVAKKPEVRSFKLDVIYPPYTNKENESFSNLNDINVPEGSKLKWLFNLPSSDSLLFYNELINSRLSTPANINIVAKKSFNYSFCPFNKDIYADTSSYFVQVVKDKFPTIQVKQWQDSTSFTLMYFNGEINDDYGFTKFLVGKMINESITYIDTLEFTNGLTQQNFFYAFDYASYIGEENIHVVFDIWDNDAINGAKKTRSELFKISIPSKSDVQNKSTEVAESIVDEMKKSLEDSKNLQEEWKKFNDDLKNKKNTDWQDKKKLEQLLNKQQQLEKQLEQIKNKKEQKSALENLSPTEKNKIIQKQEAVNKLFEDLMSDEMKKMMQEIEKLMQELNKDELQNKMEDFEMNNEQLNQELDRTLEIFKQLELEKMVVDATEKLEDLAKKQKELAEQSKDKNANTESLKKEQEKLNKEFSEVKEQLKDIEKKNSELENPAGLPETEEQSKEIEEDMQNASESLEKNKQKKASEDQNAAGEKMQQMAQQMQQSMEASEEEQQEEDMDALRALLENIIHLSFDQEAAMASLKELNPLDPMYLEINRKQRQFKDNSVIIQDSLFALSKRVPQISNIVNKEISDLTQNMGKAIEALAESQTSNALSRQQYAMTSLNNLALLLDEALQQMQQASQKSGSGSCNKPGQGKKPNSAKMQSMQKQMAKQLDALKKAMEQGKKPGDKNNGKNGKPNVSSGLSKELAKIAAEQAAMREEIKKLSEELENGKDGVGNELKEISKELDKMEEEIALKNISPELIKRQQDIMTRLLKAENAEREREFDNKRESKSADKLPKGNQLEYLEYKKQKLNEMELLKTLPADLKPFYKEKINTYFNQPN